MRRFVLILLASAGVLATSNAFAADVFTRTEQVITPADATHVRLICDEDGRCYRSRGGRRVIIREGYDSYDYTPRERYIERRYYDDGPRVGVGIGGPGVGVGIGFGDRDRW